MTQVSQTRWDSCAMLGAAKSFAFVILVNLANNAARDYKNWNIKHRRDYLLSTLLAFISSALMPHIREKKVSSFICKLARLLPPHIVGAKSGHASSSWIMRTTKWQTALINCVILPFGRGLWWCLLLKKEAKVIIQCSAFQNPLIQVSHLADASLGKLYQNSNKLVRWNSFIEDADKPAQWGGKV
jgi:hypothetical protein